uniref:CASP-like protein n=1 Tax=Chlamydomonas euryale TaxID=1486919 RepID=A0A7R9YQT4_9CHLO|mmetsp:Transcript_11144/g.33158  ORF Transcript_11144/g.33158 Transcript_11144/m.33158 type:complete len:186 (+) Transcript_11144:205-762(+)
MKSGGAVLVTAAAQLLVGLCLLGIYEGYKLYFFNEFLKNEASSDGVNGLTRASSYEYEDPLDYRSPMGASYVAAVLNNIFSVFGITGILYAQKELVTAFFAFNAVQMVVAFFFFTDLLVDQTIGYGGEPSKLNSYVQAAATFICFNFMLSIAATVYALRSVEEIRAKQREDLGRMGVLPDTSLDS